MKQSWKYKEKKYTEINKNLHLHEKVYKQPQNQSISSNNHSLSPNSTKGIINWRKHIQVDIKGSQNDPVEQEKAENIMKYSKVYLTTLMISS